MSLIVHVQEHAFQAMLIACIEIFPSSYLPLNPGKTKRRKNKPHDGEAIGLLFGQRVVKGDHLVFNVSLTVTMQATKRGPDEVQYSRFHFERIREITESFPHLEFLGTFHSHPWTKEEYGSSATVPSEEDEETAVDAAAEYGDELLEIILGITALSINSYRDAKVDRHSIDSCCGRYKYRLSAYCTVGAVDEETDHGDEDAGERGANVDAGLQPVDKLVCPFAAHGGGIFT